MGTDLPACIAGSGAMGFTRSPLETKLHTQIEDDDQDDYDLVATPPSSSDFFSAPSLSRLKTASCEDNFHYAEGGTAGYPRYDHRSSAQYDVSGDVAKRPEGSRPYQRKDAEKLHPHRAR